MRDAASEPPAPPPLDHGGDLAAAIARFGGDAAGWLDLSTGVNPRPWPVGALSRDAWTRLPGRVAHARLIAAARAAYAAPDPAAGAAIVAAPGAQALIQLLPRLRDPGRVGVVGPTYEEHAAAFRAEGWTVVALQDPAQARGLDALVAVNPNNPDGRAWAPDALLAAGPGLIVVDESFIDATPALSLAPAAGAPGLVVLRSFGKFYGLAGVRLGFALCGAEDAARLSALLGPWATSGPALEIGAAALADARWAAATRARLGADAARLAALGRGAGWGLVGATALFATFDTPDGRAAQAGLARARIWSRAFAHSPRWLRLGLPGDPTGWARLAQALA